MKFVVANGAVCVLDDAVQFSVSEMQDPKVRHNLRAFIPHVGLPVVSFANRNDLGLSIPVDVIKECKDRHNGLCDLYAETVEKLNEISNEIIQNS